MFDNTVYDHEQATQLYQSMRTSCGCNDCPEEGNNGCGLIFIDGYEFEPDYEGGANWYKDSRDDSCLECYKRAAERREHTEHAEYEQMKADKASGTFMFRACIKVALELMPKDCTPDVYGDIVRSAAAVCCHNSSEEK